MERIERDFAQVHLVWNFDRFEVGYFAQNRVKNTEIFIFTCRNIPPSKNPSHQSRPCAAHFFWVLNPPAVLNPPLLRESVIIVIIIQR